MSQIVVDVLYIKMIEKTIRRPLTQEELEQATYGEGLFLQKPNGMWMSFAVPLYRHPYDLMPKDTDARAIEAKTENGNVFDYTANVGPTEKVKCG